MIKIHCPNNNLPERKWILTTLITDLIGLRFSVTFDSTDHYRLCYNDKEIVIEDHFFNRHASPLQYLSKENIPHKTEEMMIAVGQNQISIINIYGRNMFSRSGSTIHCGSDIFASAFFMLTRWEESFIEEKDEYGSADEYKTLSVRNKFYKRPVVNEYAELLIHLLQEIGVNIAESEKKFDAYITYDVDDLFFRKSRKLKSTIRSLGADIIKRRDPRMFINRILYSLKNLSKDLYDPFNELAEDAQRYALKNYFLFKPQLHNEKGATYDIFSEDISPILATLKEKGCNIDMHCSDAAYNNPELFAEEHDRLSKFKEGEKISFNRVHTLQFTYDTFRMCQKQGIEVDSTLGFHFHNGFKCGICQKYQMFDYELRKTIDLWQLPISAKDNGSLIIDSKPETMYKDITQVIDTVKKYNGDFVLVWHTNKVNTFEHKRYKPVLKNIFTYLHNTVYAS